MGLKSPFGSFSGDQAKTNGLVERLTQALGEPMETGIPTLTRLAPTAERVAGVGTAFLTALGIPGRQGEAIVSVASAVKEGRLHLEPSADVETTLQTLQQISGIGERSATAIVVRALHWPDAFDANDLTLQRAAGITGSRALLRRAEQWRPWRAYAAAHLLLHDSARRA